MNPVTPKLYGLINNHKPGNPIRPLLHSSTTQLEV